MPISARHGVAGLVIATVLATAACTNPAGPPTVPTTAPAPTTAPTSTTTSTEATSTTTAAAPQQAAAEATVAKLWALVDALGADPKRSLDELTTVTRDQSLATWRELLTQRRRQGHRQTGTTSIVSSEATRGGGKLTVDTCIDVSQTNLVDKNGKSIVSAERRHACATPPWCSRGLMASTTSCRTRRWRRANPCGRGDCGCRGARVSRRITRVRSGPGDLRGALDPGPTEWPLHHCAHRSGKATCEANGHQRRRRASRRLRSPGPV